MSRDARACNDIPGFGVKVWPDITLLIVPDAGHSSREPGTMRLLVEVSILVPEVYNPLILAARPRQAADRFSDF